MASKKIMMRNEVLIQEEAQRNHSRLKVGMYLRRHLFKRVVYSSELQRIYDIRCKVFVHPV